MADEKKIPLNQIRSEDGAHELATTADMKLYLEIIKAKLQGKSTALPLFKVAELPLERRYVWRVASALKWAFVDLETENVETDLRTLQQEDLDKVVALVAHRPLQFCLFLKALVGQEGMERLIGAALEAASQSSDFRD